MANLNEMIDNDVQILERDSSKLHEGVLAQVLRTVCWIDEKNANNRRYRKAVWEGVFGRDDFKRKMENRQVLGEYEHPESSALKLDKDRTSHIVSKMYFGDPVMREGKMRTPVKAVFDLLPTDAGKFIWILHEAGVKVGASTRADGSLVEQIDEDGSKYMDVNEKDYRFVCIDHTGDPSCSNTEPESIVSAVRNHYEAHDINKNVAIALLENVQSEAAKALEKIIKEDKQHTGCKHKLLEKECSGCCSRAKESQKDNMKTTVKEEKTSNPDNKEPQTDLEKNIKRNKALDKPGKDANGKTQKVSQTMTAEATVKEELTTTSDTSGQPANLAAAKQDVENSRKRGEEVDKKLDDVTDQSGKMVQQEAKVDEEKVRQFIHDNWEMFLEGTSESKSVDAARNVAKVFNITSEAAVQYVKDMQPKPVITETQKQLVAVRDNYAKDVIKFSMEIAELKEKNAKLTENYSKDSISFVTELAESKKGKLALDAAVDVALRHVREKETMVGGLHEQIEKLKVGHTKTLGELNEKTNKLAKDIAVKDAAIKEAEGRIKQLKEANGKEIKDLKEQHHRETINLYVDYRLKSMRLKLHEKVLTLLRQSNSTNEVDTLIRETQDALREGLAQSVGNISEITLERPVDKNQVDITNKVGIALKHLTGL